MIRRRDFITLLGGAAAAWPLAARAQRPIVIGYLDYGSLEARREIVVPVLRGLAESGYVEGRNLAIEYRFAPVSDFDLLTGLAADLVKRQVAAIVVPGGTEASAAKRATQTIPIIFATAGDPVGELVTSLNRPGGNVTGVSSLISTVTAKRLELLHELTPGATSLAYLANLVTSGVSKAETRELQAAAQTLGLRLLILSASDPSEFEVAFAAMVREGAGGLVVSGSRFFTLADYTGQLIALAARYGVPAIYARREGAAAGGLMSYGTDFPEMYRQVGMYAGRILKGENPADLPVQQVTKMELVINMKTAKALGVTFPLTLIGRADEVIE
jgi:putative ABC transport system substrate-binding protein